MGSGSGQAKDKPGDELAGIVPEIASHIVAEVGAGA